MASAARRMKAVLGWREEGREEGKEERDGRRCECDA